VKDQNTSSEAPVSISIVAEAEPHIKQDQHPMKLGFSSKHDSDSHHVGDSATLMQNKITFRKYVVE
jgi:hypothetical protein